MDLTARGHVTRDTDANSMLLCVQQKEQCVLCVSALFFYQKDQLMVHNFIFKSFKSHVVHLLELLVCMIIIINHASSMAGKSIGLSGKNVSIKSQIDVTITKQSSF